MDLRNGWVVCKVWADRWAEGEGKGGVEGPLLMKQKKRENLLRNLHRRRKNFFFIYDVIVKQFF